MNTFFILARFLFYLRSISGKFLLLGLVLVILHPSIVLTVIEYSMRLIYLLSHSLFMGMLLFFAILLMISTINRGVRNSRF
jgi:hypothetical protein